MNDVTDHDALRRQLALLCCQMRGLNPDHVAPGTSEPLWRTRRIMDTVDVMTTIAGSHDAAARHVELAAAMAA